MTDTFRLLCVDDEPGLARLVATYLERDDDLGCDTAVETDPREALRRVERESFDCVVSDYDMPGLTGVELLSAAREVEPELPFLLFSATGPDEIAAEMVRAGVSDYVSKHGGADGYTALLRRVKRAEAGESGRFDAGFEDGRLRDVALDGVCTVSRTGPSSSSAKSTASCTGTTPRSSRASRGSGSTPTPRSNTSARTSSRP